MKHKKIIINKWLESKKNKSQISNVNVIFSSIETTFLDVIYNFSISYEFKENEAFSLFKEDLFLSMTFEL